MKFSIATKKADVAVDLPDDGVEWIGQVVKGFVECLVPQAPPSGTVEKRDEGEQGESRPAKRRIVDEVADAETAMSRPAKKLKTRESTMAELKTRESTTAELTWPGNLLQHPR